MENVFKNGSTVERDIDGDWFRATIQSVQCIDTKSRTYTIKYSDDGNVEEGVRGGELRPGMEDPMAGFLTIFSFVKKSTLPKPLAGLVEDDCVSRSMQKPTVTIHTDTDTDQAIIINGTADRIAVGGGLRALRYLKN